MTKLKAIKYTGGSRNLGGIETTLSNGQLFKCGESLHPTTQFTMDLDQFDVQNIQIQKYKSWGQWPCGWQLSGPNGELDVRSNVQNGLDADLTPVNVDYAKLTPDQELIGIYGFFNNEKKISNIGFIVKERVNE